MKFTLRGGFGEKGRTCLEVESQGFAILFDVGVNTSATGRDVYPAISPEELTRVRAILITHTHEDHVAALGWCVAHGFRGDVWMTAQTRRDASAIWESYAESAHRPLAESAAVSIFAPGAPFSVGPFTIRSGRSGHIAGGVWLHASDGATSLGWCGDVVPASPVFPMDAPPRADALILDASYGGDDVSFATRADAIRAWVAAHPGPVLPTPLAGRSLELIAILDAPFAIEASMREALAAQIADAAWIRTEIAPALAHKLGAAHDWRVGDARPTTPLLCHDAMGLFGPSKEILARARHGKWPVLFTGHLPAGSPGAAMRQSGEADWLRLPTHPTSSENVALVAACRPRLVLGHSCDAKDLRGLATALPALRAEAQVGDVIDL